MARRRGARSGFGSSKSDRATGCKTSPGRREALLHAYADTRVTDVALDAGYAHLGRFAADYWHRYGEAPSATLKRSVG